MNNEKATILIVDDNPINLDVLLDYLDSLGFEILVAEDGYSAFQRAKHGHPNLILLDIMMPNMNGFETCLYLKAHEATKDIPVIFMTALSRTEDKIKGFEVGGVDYITKPFQNAEILARINTHLTIQNLQKQLQTHNKELQAHNKELDTFAHTIAHNLANPLNLIIGNAEILQENVERLSVEESKEYISAIIRSGKKMDDIINALLLLARVRQKDVLLEPLDMPLIIEDAKYRLTQMIDKYQPNLVIPNQWPQAIGYAPWIEEVWVNYLSNAIKYGGTGKIELGATVDPDGMICFWIKDTGPGIPLKEQSRLFSPFTRFHSKEIEGDGLGLSIVEHIVKKSGGQVGVNSQGIAGKGSIFSFTLPQITTQESEFEEQNYDQ